MIKICIRMDDITPDMDYAKFLRFKKLCDLYQVKPLIGVVPINQDENLHIEEAHEDFWDFILELQKEGWVVAQHGCYHIYTSKKMGLFPLNRLSEFTGKPYQKQLELLKTGKNELNVRGIETDFFMAPAHSYDKNTVKALKKLGFTKITDGFGCMPYMRRGMTFYPIAFQQSLAVNGKDGYTTLVFHTNTMKESDFENLEKLLAEHKEQMLNYSEMLEVKPEKRGFLGQIKEYIMAYLKYALVRIRSLLK